MSAPVFDVAEVSRAFALLHPPGHTFELRVPSARLVRFNGRPDPRPGTAFGFFNSAEAALAALPALEGAEWPAVYVSLNPVTPALLARASNRIKAADRKSASTSDRDVESRAALLVDVDPVRPADISATDEEHAAALESAARIRGRLAEMGWPAPVVADSGNGAHLVYRLDMPAEDHGAVKDFTAALADVFDVESVHVDRTVFNAARIVKLWGTAARKGDDTADRPHRMSKLLEVPAEWKLVPAELIRETTAALRAEKPAPKTAPSPASGHHVGSFNVRDFIARHFPEADERSWSSGTRWILDPCPFNPDHTGTSAAILQSSSGVLSFKCQHSGCAGLEWKDLRERYEPSPARSTRAADTPTDPANVAHTPTAEVDAGVGAPGLVVLSVGEMLERAWPPREQMLSPFITSKSLSMIHAYRGYGKTWLGHTIGLAVASGGVALPSPFEFRCAWSAPTPRRVVLIDGEMPAGVIKARLVQLISGNLYEPDGRLFIIADDAQPEGLPSLSNAAGRERIGEKLGDAELVILDNISTLFRGLDENEADGWDDAQEWLIRLRREGRSVLLVHHSGKSGAQRGTSKREDVLDAVIKLSRPADYCEEEAARFEIHFEKARGFAGLETLPFEAQLTVKDGLATWKTGPLAEAAETAEMLKLKSAGKSHRAIAAELGVDHTTVSRRLKKAARREQADGGAVLPFGAHHPRTTAPGGHK